VQERLECNCFSGYGLTETSPVIAISRHRPGRVQWNGKSDPIERLAMTGYAIPSVEIRVVDPDDHDVPRDAHTIGEIVTRCNGAMRGYWRQEKLTAETFRGGWLHTGDMATIDEHGYILIVDRKKQIIISGGENISSLEVEAAIFAHPAVLECAVVAAPDPKWGEVPAAIVMLKEGMTLSGEDLLGFLKTRLGKFKLPRIIEFSSDALPKTGTGKIRKNELRERFWAGKDKRVQG
jgi:fatty-acyl-CoA synthase